MSAPPKTSKVKDTEPIKMWAELSEDVPPSIWDVAWYRHQLRQDRRHVRVMVTPIIRRSAKRSKR